MIVDRIRVLFILTVGAGENLQYFYTQNVMTRKNRLRVKQNYLISFESGNSFSKFFPFLFRLKEEKKERKNRELSRWHDERKPIKMMVRNLRKKKKKKKEVKRGEEK